MFWLKIPYVADVALVLLGVGLLLGGRTVGWWVLLFAALRAIVGTIALFWIAPRMIANRAQPPSVDNEDGDGDDSTSDR